MLFYVHIYRDRSFKEVFRVGRAFSLHEASKVLHNSATLGGAVSCALLLGATIPPRFVLRRPSPRHDFEKCV